MWTHSYIAVFSTDIQGCTAHYIQGDVLMDYNVALALVKAQGNDGIPSQSTDAHPDSEF